MRELALSTVAYDGHDLDVALASTAAVGFEAVELAYIEGYADTIDDAVFAGEEAARAAAMLRAHGLRCSAVSAHIDLADPRAVERMISRIRYAAGVGARRVVTNAASLAAGQGFDATVRALLPHAERHGVVICLENPGSGVPNVVNDGATAVAVLERIGHPLLRLNYDFANALSHFPWRFATEADFVQTLPWLEQLHLKDVRRGPAGDFSFPALGEGEVDFTAVIEVLRSERAVALSVELPLRLRRNPGGRPWRLPDPLPREEIDAVVQRSRSFLLDLLGADAPRRAG